jgi:CDP-4-dehydro-6-deoxyglucose reductase, E3
MLPCLPLGYKGDSKITSLKLSKRKTMSRVIYNMHLKKVIDHTENVRELILTCQEPQSFQFKAGQFVMLHVPQAEGKPALRAYSIATDDRDSNGYRLLFKYVETGKASEYVWSLKGDEILQFTGPFGKVFFQEPPTEQIVFLNTGTGLSQHLSYLQSKKNQYPHLNYKLLFGVRSEKDMYYAEVLNNLKIELPNFHWEFVLSRPQESWTGKKGYVQNFIEEFNYLHIPTTFYLCGNGGMIKEVKQTLAAQNFDPKKIWVEAFD